MVSLIFSHTAEYALRAMSFLDILEPAGYNAHPGCCVFGREKCDGDHPCPLHEDWSALNGKFPAWARATNLTGIAQGGAGGRKK